MSCPTTFATASPRQVPPVSRYVRMQLHHCFHSIPLQPPEQNHSASGSSKAPSAKNIYGPRDMRRSAEKFRFLRRQAAHFSGNEAVVSKRPLRDVHFEPQLLLGVKPGFMHVCVIDSRATWTPALHKSHPRPVTATGAHVLAQATFRHPATSITCEVPLTGSITSSTTRSLCCFMFCAFSVI